MRVKLSISQLEWTDRPRQSVTEGTEEKSFAFEAATWAAVLPHQIELQAVFRQQDPVFVATLNRVRVGHALESDIALLRATSHAARPAPAPGTPSAAVVATRLCTHVHEASTINAACVCVCCGRWAEGCEGFGLLWVLCVNASLGLPHRATAPAAAHATCLGSKLNELDGAVRTYNAMDSGPSEQLNRLVRAPPKVRRASSESATA